MGHAACSTTEAVSNIKEASGKLTRAHDTAKAVVRHLATVHQSVNPRAMAIQEYWQFVLQTRWCGSVLTDPDHSY